MASDETITRSEDAPQGTSPTPEPSPSRGFNLLSALDTPAGQTANSCVLAAILYFGAELVGSGQVALAAFSGLLFPTSVAVILGQAPQIKKHWKPMLAGSLVMAGMFGGAAALVELETQDRKAQDQRIVKLITQRNEAEAQRIAALPELDPKTLIVTPPPERP